MLFSDQGCILVQRHNLCVSGIPKSASSTMNILLRRMEGIPGWNDTHGRTHGAVNGLKWANSAKDFDLYARTYKNTSIVKIAVIREPANRLRSAYLDKIYKLHEFGRIGYKGKKVPTLNAVSAGKPFIMCIILLLSSDCASLHKENSVFRALSWDASFGSLNLSASFTTTHITRNVFRALSLSLLNFIHS